ncbi:MAG: putative O-glycosylation ligase, exosortase A system-associated [Pseudomonadota bacterium]
MRDLMVLGALLVFIPFSLSNVFGAYLLWGWTGLIALNSYLYGFMVPVPFVQLFALLTLATLLWHKDIEKRKFEPNRTTTLFAIFVVHGFFCAIFAYPNLLSNWMIYGNLSKTVLFCVLMPILATSRFRIHSIVVMISLAVGFHGVLDGLKFLASGGAHKAAGIGKFGDNNHYAIVLAMVIPLLYYLYQYSSGRLARWGFAAAILLNVLAIVATGSRGGLVGLTAISLWIIVKSRRRWLGIFAISVCALLIVQLAPDTWSQRMQTIKTADEDTSFMSRVTAWKVSSAIALANPVLGGGFRVVQSHSVWDQFKSSPGLLGFVETPVLSRSGVAAHSIWFEVMGDMGFVGLFIFIAMIINAFMTGREIRALAERGGTSWRWASDLSDLLAAIMFVYAVSGSLLSVAYFELPYVVMMLLEVIKLQLRTALNLSPVKKSLRLNHV